MLVNILAKVMQSGHTATIWLIGMVYVGMCWSVYSRLPWGRGLAALVAIDC